MRPLREAEQVINQAAAIVAILATQEISDNVFRLACRASSGASYCAIRLAGPGAGAETVLIVSIRRSSTVFAAFANVGYCHQDSATDHTHPGSKPSKKGKVNMGDKSPKSVHKQVAQKQVKANAADQKKQQAAAAKRVAGKK
jgi:hypothetical protein